MPSRKAGAARNERPARYAVYAAFLVLIFLIVATGTAYSSGAITETSYLVYASIAQSFIFSFIVLAYLFATGSTARQAAARLGLSRKSWGFKYVLHGIALFFAVFLLEILLSLFQAVTGVQLPTNVMRLFHGVPFYFILFSVFIAPINEEVLFRGFLVPGIRNVLLSGVPKRRRGLKRVYTAPMWAGIIISALVFGGLHYLSYASISEFLVALAFGIMAGYIRTKRDSLYPSIIAHIMVNFLGLLLLAVVI